MEQEGAAPAGLDEVILGWIGAHHAESMPVAAFVDIESTLMRAAAALWHTTPKIGRVVLNERRFIRLVRRAFAETRAAAVRAGDVRPK